MNNLTVGAKVYRNVSHAGERMIPGVIIEIDATRARARIKWEAYGNTGAKRTWYGLARLTTVVPVYHAPGKIGTPSGARRIGKYQREIAEFQGKIEKAEKRLAKLPMPTGDPDSHEYRYAEVCRDSEIDDIARYNRLIAQHKEQIAKL